MPLMLGVHRLCCWCLWRDDLLLVHDVCVFARHRTITHVFVVGRILGLWLTWNSDRTTAQHLQRVHHGAREIFRILLTREIQSVNIFRVAPLMKCGGGLIVLQSLENRAVDDDFVVLKLSSDDAECVVLLMMVDLHLAEAGRVARWNPLLEILIVHHHRSSRSDDTLFAAHFRVDVKIETYTECGVEEKEIKLINFNSRDEGEGSWAKACLLARYLAEARISSLLFFTLFGADLRKHDVNNEYGGV